MPTTVDLLAQAVQVIIIATGTYALCFAAAHAELHDLERRMAELETEHRAAMRERELDLERWKDGIAAQVGHDLEGVEDKIMAAIEGSHGGEDVSGTLCEAHMLLVDVIADLLTMNPDEDEAA